MRVRVYEANRQALCSSRSSGRAKSLAGTRGPYEGGTQGRGVLKDQRKRVRLAQRRKKIARPRVQRVWVCDAQRPQGQRRYPGSAATRVQLYKLYRTPPAMETPGVGLAHAHSRLRGWLAIWRRWCLVMKTNPKRAPPGARGGMAGSQRARRKHRRSRLDLRFLNMKRTAATPKPDIAVIILRWRLCFFFFGASPWYETRA